jgi:hypothetical protein
VGCQPSAPTPTRGTTFAARIPSISNRGNRPGESPISPGTTPRFHTRRL